MGKFRFKQPRALWLGRRNGECSAEGSCYELGTHKKYWEAGRGFIMNGDLGYLFGFCEKEFEKATGVRLAAGDVVKVKINIEVQ